MKEQKSGCIIFVCITVAFCIRIITKILEGAGAVNETWELVFSVYRVLYSLGMFVLLVWLWGNYLRNRNNRL